MSQDMTTVSSIVPVSTISSIMTSVMPIMMSSMTTDCTTMQMTHMMMAMLSVMPVMKTIHMTSKVTTTQILVMRCSPCLIMIPGFDRSGSPVMTVIHVSVMLVPVMTVFCCMMLLMVT